MQILPASSICQAKKRVIPLVCKTGHNERTAELLKSLYIFPFYDLIRYKINIYMFKVYHEMLPMTILKLFTQLSNKIKQDLLFYT